MFVYMLIGAPIVPLNPKVGGPGLPGIDVEEQQQQQLQQTVGCQTLKFKKKQSKIEQEKFC